MRFHTKGPNDEPHRHPRFISFQSLKKDRIKSRELLLKPYALSLAKVKE